MDKAQEAEREKRFLKQQETEPTKQTPTLCFLLPFTRFFRSLALSQLCFRPFLVKAHIFSFLFLPFQVPFYPLIIANNSWVSYIDSAELEHIPSGYFVTVSSCSLVVKLFSALILFNLQERSDFDEICGLVCKKIELLYSHSPLDPFSFSWFLTSETTMAAASMKGVSFTGSYEVGVEVKEKKFKSSEGLACKNELKGRKVLLREQSGSFASWNPKTQSCSSITAQSSIYIPQVNRWWEKSMKPNMIEITSAQDLADSLRSAGDKLVVVGFYSPSCGGCKTLHPKICQLAESNPNALFLTVNYDEHRSMCYTLHIRVLPFFRFYRGAQGRVCNFSCTNATIYKFKNALENHGTDRCSLGPAKGLEESELRSLASNKEIQFNYPLRPHEDEDLALSDSSFSDSLVRGI